MRANAIQAIERQKKKRSDSLGPKKTFLKSSTTTAIKRATTLGIASI